MAQDVSSSHYVYNLIKLKRRLQNSVTNIHINLIKACQKWNLAIEIS